MNMTVMDHSKNETERCMCGGLMHHKIETVTRIIREKEIKIHHVPFFECVRCGDIEYDLSTRISTIVVGAYKRGLTDVIWSSELFLEDET